MIRSIEIATTDTSPAQALIPVVESFLRHGDVTIMADGASSSVWHKWAETYSSFAGSINFVDTNYWFLASKKPDWQIVGASSNPGVEYTSLNYAHTKGVRTAVFVDIDGAHRRFTADIGFVTVFFAATNSVAVEILKDYPNAKVVVTGSPSAKIADSNKKTGTAIQNCGFTKESTVTWAAGGTLSDLKLAVDSLMNFMQDYALMVGVHPDPKKVAGIDQIRKITQPLRKQGRLLWDEASKCNIPGNTVQKGLASSLTIGASSLVLDEIAYNGGRACSVVDLETLTAFSKVCPKVLMFPGVTAGRVVATSIPCNLENLEFPDISDVRKTMGAYLPKLVIEALGL